MGKHDTPKANEGTQEAMVIGAPYIYSCECDTSVVRFSKFNGAMTAAGSFLVHGKNRWLVLWNPGEHRIGQG